MLCAIGPRCGITGGIVVEYRPHAAPARKFETVFGLSADVLQKTEKKHFDLHRQVLTDFTDQLPRGYNRMPCHSTVTHIRVRYAETDQMGVVYHANYLIWMEVARTDLCRSLGSAYRDMESGTGFCWRSQRRIAAT